MIYHNQILSLYLRCQCLQCVLKISVRKKYSFHPQCSTEHYKKVYRRKKPNLSIRKWKVAQCLKRQFSDISFACLASILLRLHITHITKCGYFMNLFRQFYSSKLFTLYLESINMIFLINVI